MSYEKIVTMEVSADGKETYNYFTIMTAISSCHEVQYVKFPTRAAAEDFMQQSPEVFDLNLSSTPGPLSMLRIRLYK
jgi:hypothetical protein